MKENWIQLIDTIEKDPFETEAFFALMDYVGEASDDDKCRVVQEVERRIKMIARYDADKSFLSVSSVSRSGRCLIPFGVLG